MMENSQIHGNCLNCHTQNRTNPDQYVFHVRGAHGATVISKSEKRKVNSEKLEVLQARNDSLGGSMVYPYWHPEGRYCAFSTNKTAQIFHMGNNKRIEVYDTASDVFVYDTQNHVATGWKTRLFSLLMGSISISLLLPPESIQRNMIR